MKIYIAIFYVLISGACLAYEIGDKENRYVSVAPKDIFNKAFKEPLLTNTKYKNDVYRFTILPSSGRAMTFRLTILDELKGQLYFKRLSGIGPFDLGVVDLSYSIVIKGKAFTELLKIVKTPKAHQVYGDLTETDVNFLTGLDGSSWYLESLTKRGYSCTYVQSAHQLEVITKLLIEDGWGEKAEKMKRISLELDAKPFVLVCSALAKAGEYELNSGREVFKPIKTANKSQ